MRIYTFTMQDQDLQQFEGATNQQVSISFTGSDATVDNLLYHFKTFLQACGYCFNFDDTFEIVNDFKAPHAK